MEKKKIRGLIPLCLICDKEMLSDALAKKYCKLCGMIINNNTDKFCCENCGDKYSTIKNKR